MCGFRSKPKVEKRFVLVSMSFRRVLSSTCVRCVDLDAYSTYFEGSSIFLRTNCHGSADSALVEPKKAFLDKCQKRSVLGGRKAIFDVSKRACVAFKLRKVPPYDAIPSIFRDKDRIVMKSTFTHDHTRSDSFVISDELENTMIQWFWRIADCNIIIYDAVIAEKARKVRLSLN